MAFYRSLPLSPSAKPQLGLIVQTGELVKKRSQERRTFNYFALVLLLEGQGWYRDQGHEVQEVEAGDIIFLFPGIWHEYGPRQDGHWKEAYVVFEGPVFDLWREMKWLDPSCPVVRAGSPQIWHHRMKSLLVQQELHTAEDALEETCRLQHLLTDLRKGQENRQLRPGDREWVRTVRNLLEQKSGSLTDISAGVNMSPDAFRKRFSHTFGEPFRHYLNRRRIERACRLLVETRLTSRKIAEALGFCDEYYFCRAFKRTTGYSPKEYRRSLEGFSNQAQ